MTPEDIPAEIYARVRDEVRRGRRRDRLVLTSWGMAVLILAGLFSAWVANNDRQQDRDLCALISVFQGGPEPVPGPEGDRARTIRRALDDWSGRRHCPPR
jgi:hypothetical protein